MAGALRSGGRTMGARPLSDEKCECAGPLSRAAVVLGHNGTTALTIRWASRENARLGHLS